jgi:choline dehydrogenase
VVMTGMSILTIDRKPLRPRYDYIVVGSGSAGSVVARRLAEDAGSSVLLLEAGPVDSSIYIRMPAALGFPLMNDKYNWFLHTEPEPGLDGRNILEARGRVLGGSSSINGMNWVRGNPWDYDNWEAQGLRGWSYGHVLPYFRKAETFEGGSNAYRGGSGPMKIGVSEAKNPLFQAFLRAGVEAGYPLVEDHNAYRQEGMHITQSNIGRGIRWSTAEAYLRELGVPANLDVVCNATVRRIRFSGKLATGVEIQAGAQRVKVEAQGELILCGGAIHSPHLLMLSGVGDAQDLKDLGISSVAHLPGVGRNLRDHIAAGVQYRETKNVSTARKLGPAGRVKLGLEWLLFKRGIGASNFFEVGGFIRTREDLHVPNVQFEFLPLLGELMHGSVKLENGFQYFFSLMRPTSAGRVELRSADPSDPPKFQFNFLTTQQDRQDAIDAVKEIRRIVAQPAWSEFRGVEVTPGPEAVTNEQILAFLRRTAGTNYHPCCTCRMGTDDTAVVDADAKVYGLDNLRVVDASILPEIVSGNLNAPVIMMAEKLSDTIRGRAPLEPTPLPYYDPLVSSGVAEPSASAALTSR